MRMFLAVPLLLSHLSRASSQTSPDCSYPEESAPARPQAEQNRSVLGVAPGTEAIKEKDLFEKTGYWHPFRRMPKFILIDQKRIWTSPFHTSKKDARWWFIFGGATAGLVAADQHVSKHAPTTPGLVTAGNAVSYLGDAYTLVPIAAGFYFIGSAASSEHFRETGMLSFETLINATVVELTLKSITDRARPLEGDGEGHFWASNHARYNSSFPSGHAIETFALASVFAHEYSHKAWVQVLVYAYAAGVVGARLAANQHFPGDVMAGGAIGWFIGDYVYGKRHNPELDRHSTLDRLIAPWTGSSRTSTSAAHCRPGSWTIQRR